MFKAIPKSVRELEQAQFDSPANYFKPTLRTQRLQGVFRLKSFE